MKTKLIASLTIILALGATSALAATAGENWENHCAKCHGTDGKAQTKLGQKMKLKDYTVATSLAKFTDADLVKATAEGVPFNENPSAVYAAVRNLLYEGGKKIDGDAAYQKMVDRKSGKKVAGGEGK